MKLGQLLAAWTERTAGSKTRMSAIAKPTSSALRRAAKAISRIGVCMVLRRRDAPRCFEPTDDHFEVVVRVPISTVDGMSRRGTGRS